MTKIQKERGRTGVRQPEAGFPWIKKSLKLWALNLRTEIFLIMKCHPASSRTSRNEKLSGC